MLVSLAGLVLLCLVGSLSVYWAAGQVLNAAADHEAYVVMIGPGDNLHSDNARLESQVNGARSALAAARELSLALAIATAGIGMALCFRLARRVGAKGCNALEGKPGGKKAPFRG